MKDAGISNVMALRGDIPADMLGDDRTKWDYNHAIELVRELRESGGDFCIGGACYPEVHPESRNADEDIKHLLEKVNAGCDFLTTQMFFDNELFYAFFERARGAGINVPIIPGIMPITRAAGEVVHPCQAQADGIGQVAQGALLGLELVAAIDVDGLEERVFGERTGCWRAVIYLVARHEEQPCADGLACLGHAHRALHVDAV